MTSRSEAEALRSLLKRLNYLASTHYELFREAQEKYEAMEDGKGFRSNPLYALTKEHSEAHYREWCRLTDAETFYVDMLAQAEERERASQDNQS